jgi:signal transduction histidine kinase
VPGWRLRLVLWVDHERPRFSYDDRVHALLRSVWDEPRPPRPSVPAWRDRALVGLLLLATVLEGALKPDLPWRAVALITAVGMVPTLLWRRSRPLLMVTIVFATCSLVTVFTGAPAQLDTLAFVVLLPYSLFRWGSGRDAVIGSTIMIVKVSLMTLAASFGLTDLFGAFAVLSAVCAVGAAVRYRARARARELDQVALLERERLARDLHDTVAHHVSAIAIRAQAGLATAAVRPDAAIEALRVIEAEASRTLAEMRSMVHVLRRNQPPDLAPSPRVADLEQLASRTRAGPAVDVEIFGELDDLPPSVGAAVYRLAQESVTNARRHARHATRIEVHVAADDKSVRLRVSDDGDASAVRPAGSPGFGLIGMIERAHLLGGTCEAGPAPDRGWTVSAVLPRTGWAT